MTVAGTGRPGTASRSTLRSLLPLAAGLVVFGLGVAWLLQGDDAIGAWLLAAFLSGHGGVHLLYLMPRPPADETAAGGPDFPFDLRHSWLVPGGDARPLRLVGTALVTMVVVGFLAAALATVGLLVPTDWWAASVLVSSALSVLLMALFFQPGLILGLAIDAVLIAVVVTSAWSPSST